MDKKKEIQAKIIKNNNSKERITQEEFEKVLKLIAPGTSLRSALEGALKTQRGALIAIENEELKPIIDGGFRINEKFTAQKFTELCKMDGAIIISKNFKKIIHANVLLVPDKNIKSNETGTRHKAAERTAKQTGDLVIAISERKNEITLFYKNIKYPLKSTDEILRKVNENLQLLEKHRDLFDKYVLNLNKLEIRNYTLINKAINVIQKGTLILKISGEIKKYLLELGKEGTLIRNRLKEISLGVEKETNLVIKDYTLLNLKKSKTIISSLSYEELLDSDNISRSMAYELPIRTTPIRGWRILSETSLSDKEIAMLIEKSSTLGKAINSPLKYYIDLFGVEKAQIFKEEIERMKLDV